MAFGRLQTIVPLEIKDISIELTDILGDDDRSNYGAHYSVQVEMSDGRIEVLRGDLVPHLTQSQINGLIQFVQAMRVKAVEEILPV